MKTVRTLVLVLAVGAALVLAGRSDGPRSDPARVEHLSEQLRCPVCEGLSVADSPSSTARAIAADVQRRVGDGQSDEEIRTAYVRQYGSWILLEPPASGFGALIWFVPVAGVVGAAALTAWTMRRRSSTNVAQPSSRDLAVVAAARKGEATLTAEAPR
jgi:cytochrome c-type biogenesis protein CcmH